MNLPVGHALKKREELPIHLRRELIAAVIDESRESDLAPTEILHRAAFLGLKQFRFRRTVYAPEILAHCHLCGRKTGTAFKFLPAGIGNACAVCGCFRRGEPYISRQKFKTLMPAAAEGDSPCHQAT